MRVAEEAPGVKGRTLAWEWEDVRPKLEQRSAYRDLSGGDAEAGLLWVQWCERRYQEERRKREARRARRRSASPSASSTKRRRSRSRSGTPDHSDDGSSDAKVQRRTE